MTQTPLPPPETPEPLDDAERELARALRSLPAGLPPPELDARILGAARRSVHLAQPRKRGRGWLIGIGTAASALLAIGVLFRTHSPGENAFFTPTAPTASAVPSQQAVPAPAAAEAQKPSAQSAPAAADAAMPVRTSAPPAAEPPAEETAVPPVGNPQVAPATVQQAPNPSQNDEGLMQSSNARAVAAKQVPEAFPGATVSSRPTKPAHYPSPPPPPVVMDEPEPLAEAPSAPMAAPAPTTAIAPPPAPPPPRDARNERKTESDSAAARQDAQAESGAAKAPAAAGGAVAGQQPMEKDELRGQALKKSAQPPASASAEGSLGAGEDKAKSLDRLDATGSRIRRSSDDKESSGPNDGHAWTVPPPIKESGPEDTLPWTVPPPIESDARLTPAHWIERVRERVKAGDDDGARLSLQRFHVRYPDASIPDDLKPLMQ